MIKLFGRFKIKTSVKAIVVISGIGIGLFLSSCATDGTINTQAEYEQGEPRSSSELIVPPGLMTPEVDDTYTMVQLKTKNRYTLDHIPNMHITTAGAERWLLVNNTTVNQLFPVMQAYINNQGMKIQYTNQSIGLIQTAWFNKNRSESQSYVKDFFEWIGLDQGVHALPSLYTFRVNLWQNESNVEIFVTDYQINKQTDNCNYNAQKPLPNNKAELAKLDDDCWVSVKPNQQLELDFLLQFMAYVQYGPQKYTGIPTSNNTSPTVATTSEDKLANDKLILYDGFDRAWWRTGLALERAGLGIADKNRSLGEFYTYPLKAEVDNENPSSFDRFFGDDKSTLKLPKAQYIVKLLAQDNGSTILTINPTNKDANPNEFNKYRTKYLTMLLKELK